MKERVEVERGHTVSLGEHDDVVCALRIAIFGPLTVAAIIFGVYWLASWL